MPEPLIEYRPGKGGVPTLCLTDAGADIVFTARIRADRGTWREIAKAVGCSIPVVRRAAEEYFGDNPSIFGARGKAKKKRKRTPRPVQDAAPSVVEPASVVPYLSPSDRLLMALRKHHPMIGIAGSNSTCGEAGR